LPNDPSNDDEKSDRAGVLTDVILLVGLVLLVGLGALTAHVISH
jgi:hypothetical protein